MTGSFVGRERLGTQRGEDHEWEDDSRWKWSSSSWTSYATDWSDNQTILHLHSQSSGWRTQRTYENWEELSQDPHAERPGDPQSSRGAIALTSWVKALLPSGLDQSWVRLGGRLRNFGPSIRTSMAQHFELYYAILRMDEDLEQLVLFYLVVSKFDLGGAEPYYLIPRRTNPGRPSRI